MIAGNTINKVACFFICCLFFSGCQWFVDFDKDTYERELAIWKSQEINDYSVVQDFRSPSSGKLKGRIIVNDDNIVYKENQDKWYLAHPEDYPDDYEHPIFGFVLTIPELFERIAEIHQNYVRDYKIGSSPKIDVTYNKEYHFPERMVFSTGRLFMGDKDGYGPLTVELTEFTPLPAE